MELVVAWCTRRGLVYGACVCDLLSPQQKLVQTKAKRRGATLTLGVADRNWKIKLFFHHFRPSLVGTPNSSFLQHFFHSCQASPRWGVVFLPLLLSNVMT